MSDKRAKCHVCGRHVPVYKDGKSVGAHMLNDYMCRGSGAEITDPEFLVQWRRENCARIVAAWINEGLFVDLSLSNESRVLFYPDGVNLAANVDWNSKGEITIVNDGFAIRFPVEEKVFTLWEILGIPEPKP